MVRTSVTTMLLSTVSTSAQNSMLACIFTSIFGADTVADAKELIEEYINEEVTQYIKKYKNSTDETSWISGTRNGTAPRLSVY